MEWTNPLLLVALTVYFAFLLRLETQTTPRPPHRAA